MIKDIINSNEAVLPNTKQIEVLKENFPACFKEDGSFDIERFKEYLNDSLTVTNEGYELKFLGKNYARLLASVDTTTVVVPDEEHNNKPENKDSQNIYISGDNLDGLKQLLKSYQGKVKCIYIDPPYNTGSDGFVYNDNFNFTIEELATKLSIDEGDAKRILDLTKRGSASHSAWLMFMYPRLLLARDLLTNDGVIFISIDDNEESNLKLICDDVFGEENYLNTFTWISNITGRQISGIGAAKTHESILTYSKKIDLAPELTVNIDIAKNKMPDAYKGFNLDLREDDIGKFAIGDTLYNHNRKFNEETRPNLVFSIFYNPETEEIVTGNIGDIFEGFVEILPHPNGDGIHKYHAWRWSKEKIKNENYNLIVLPKTKGYEIFTKRRNFNTTLLKDLITNISNGDDEVKKLFDGKKVFEYPKSTDLIGVLINSINECNIVMDFFSGSGTTAHAVMLQNVEDGKQRKFISIQLPEAIDKKDIAYKIGYKTIDEIGSERIIRAAKKIKKENPSTTADLGFKHYTLEEPNRTTLDKLEKFVPEDQGMVLTNDILTDFGTQTVLTTWLVRDGYGFNADVKAIDFEGYIGYYIDKHLYLIDANITDAAIAAIVDKYEMDGNFNAENVVIFGYSFIWTKTEELKMNLARLKDTEKNLRINFDIRY